MHFKLGDNHYSWGPTKRPSAIDISCISPSVTPLCNWKVHDDSMGSYHYPTIIDIQTSAMKYDIGVPTERYIYNKADWCKFASETKSILSECSNDYSNPLKSYEEFCEGLNQIRDNTIPKFKRSTIKTPVPWWDSKSVQTQLRKVKRH